MLTRKLRGKKSNKLTKSVFIGGLIVKGVIIPIKADLKKSEYIYNYEKRDLFPATDGTSYSKFF